MINRFKAASLVGLAAVFCVTGAGSAAADLQECFRDGYLCSIQCDKAVLDQAGSRVCQSQCNADEKVCVGKIASKQRTDVPRYSPAVSSVRIKPLKAVQSSYAQ
jgi:hypothetical protein